MASKNRYASTTAPLKNLENKLLSDYNQILWLEEEFLAMKSGIEWTLFSDRNTNFFHLSTICRRHRNRTWCLRDSIENWTHESQTIKSMILAHFNTLFTSDMLYAPLHLPYLINHNSLSNDIQLTLNGDVTNLEIKQVIFSFKPYMAPGPDSFHPIFFQRYWNIVDPSIISLIKTIFQSKNVPENVNSTLIYLISKVERPETVYQFRPIDLCITLYKTVMKLLVQRLKAFLLDLIHSFQASFIPGRKASDNVILTQEIIHTISTPKSKSDLMALKIDLKKAFDRMEWSFIYHVLCWFKFPKDWFDLIMSCITSANLSVLVNGERLDSFSPSRGIRQDDPLSPYLFIFYMEYPAALIETEKSYGNWTGIKTSREGPIFSHLFFADNLFLFAKATKTKCLTVKKVLDDFYSCSSQKVNPSKFKIFFSPYTKIEHIPLIEHELGMHCTNSFGKYLEVPIITDRRDKRAFYFVIDKI